MQLLVSVMALTLAHRSALYGVYWIAGGFFMMSFHRVAGVLFLVHAETPALAIVADRLWFPAMITLLHFIGITACLVQLAHRSFSKHYAGNP